MHAKIIENELKRAGYKVEIKGKITGVSGISHTFDIVARKKNKVLCFNIAEYDLLETLLKTLIRSIDLKNKAEVYLIASRKVVEEYGVNMVSKFRILSYDTREDLLNLIKQLIS
ncbi:MAG: hypothetical protein DRN04_05415 [Thermoprotei archaeon]|nr:MAG: hypothetical protein DRN04_05415 [Thermoprotei archaeon]